MMQAETAGYVRYDALLRIENFIRTHGGEFTKDDIWEQLSKTPDYQTFHEIFTYFIDSRKIALDSDGHVCWIYNPKLVKRYRARDDLRII